MSRHPGLPDRFERASGFRVCRADSGAMSSVDAGAVREARPMTLAQGA